MKAVSKRPDHSKEKPSREERVAKFVHELRSPLMSIKAGIELLKVLEEKDTITAGLDKKRLLIHMSNNLGRLDRLTKKIINSPYSHDLFTNLSQDDEVH